MGAVRTADSTAAPPVGPRHFLPGGDYFDPWVWLTTRRSLSSGEVRRSPRDVLHVSASSCGGDRARIYRNLGWYVWHFAVTAFNAMPRVRLALSLTRFLLTPCVHRLRLRPHSGCVNPPQHGSSWVRVYKRSLTCLRRLDCPTHVMVAFLVQWHCILLLVYHLGQLSFITTIVVHLVCVQKLALCLSPDQSQFSQPDNDQLCALFTPAASAGWSPGLG
jgi:hypothetical protein